MWQNHSQTKEYSFSHMIMVIHRYSLLFDSYCFQFFSLCVQFSTPTVLGSLKLKYEVSEYSKESKKRMALTRHIVPKNFKVTIQKNNTRHEWRRSNKTIRCRDRSAERVPFSVSFWKSTAKMTE